MCNCDFYSSLTKLQDNIRNNPKISNQEIILCIEDIKIKLIPDIITFENDIDLSEVFTIGEPKK